MGGHVIPVPAFPTFHADLSTLLGVAEPESAKSGKASPIERLHAGSVQAASARWPTPLIMRDSIIVTTAPRAARTAGSTGAMIVPVIVVVVIVGAFILTMNSRRR